MRFGIPVRLQFEILSHVTVRMKNSTVTEVTEAFYCREASSYFKCFVCTVCASISMILPDLKYSYNILGAQRDANILQRFLTGGCGG